MTSRKNPPLLVCGCTRLFTISFCCSPRDDSPLCMQGACFWRLFKEDNVTGYTHWTYSIESALHEYLLQSPHRTLDPEQADFFYVPVYTSCFFHPVLGWADFPYWYGNGGGCPQTPPQPM